MTKRDENTFDFLTGREGDYMESIIKENAERPWAKPLVNDINGNGGLKGENKAKLFELRFGHALHKAGAEPRYEIAGEAQSTLDFGFNVGGREYLVEMMRLEETAAVKAATTTEEFGDGAVLVKRTLTSTGKDPKQSEEGETLKAIERICQKFEADGKPHKFPPIGAATHILLVDMRTFLNGGDKADRMHIAVDGKQVPPVFRRYWGKEDDRKLITGVFSAETKLRGATEARERLHFIGFVNEKTYEDGAIGASIQFVGNPNIFRTPEEAHDALKGWPLGEPVILNAPKKPIDLQRLAGALSSLTVQESAELATLLKEKWKQPGGH